MHSTLKLVSYLPLLGYPDFSLARVDIHVDSARLEVQTNYEGRMAFTRFESFVSTADGVDQLPRVNGSSVDNDKLSRF